MRVFRSLNWLDLDFGLQLIGGLQSQPKVQQQAGDKLLVNPKRAVFDPARNAYTWSSDWQQLTSRHPSFAEAQDWTGSNENNDTSLDGIVPNITIREPDQHGLETDDQHIVPQHYRPVPSPHSSQHLSYQQTPQQLATHRELFDQKLLIDYAESRQQFNTNIVDAPTLFMGRAIRVQQSTPTPQPLSNGHLSSVISNDQKIAASNLNAPRNVLTAILSEEPLTEGSVTSIADCLESLGYPKSWCSSPRLYYIVYKMKRMDLFPKILDAEITDLWLPLHKRLVRKWMNDTDTRTFIKYQEFILDENIPVSLQGRHFTLDNMDELDLRRIMFLGAGGFGEVHSVQNRGNGQVYACKTMARPVRFDAHAEMMRNFKREIMGMRRVHHRHCVDLIASCTDTDSVTILSHPVADSGDLSTFLDANLNLDQLKILRHSVGCITSALTYLHSLNIR